MPEQPPDPLHYEMKIPPEPDPNKQHAPEKPAAHQDERESNSAKDTDAVRGGSRPQNGLGEK